VIFELISQDHLGDQATVTVFSPGFAAPEGTALPFLGITLDAAEGDLAVVLRAPDGTRIRRVVAHPTDVFVDQSRSPDSTRLLLRADDGSATLVEVGGTARHAEPGRGAAAMLRAPRA
jgi:hypothetical protein